MAIAITRVTVRNFRSVGPDGVEFCPHMLCALVGENNAGKSNIIRAIECLLGRTWPTIHNFAEDDFYRHKRDPDVLIELELLRDGALEEMVFCRDETGEYRLHYQGSKYVHREQREQFPFVSVGATREVREHMAYDRWTALGRLLQDINREFRDDQARVQAFVDTIGRVKEILRGSERFANLETIVKAETARLLRRDVSELRIDFNLHDPWNFYRTFQVIAKDDDMDFQACETGMGLQSALTVAILRAYAQIRHSDAILAIEEPEVFLHPQAQRNFYGVLRLLADSGTQVFYTTHSPNFLDPAYFDEICLVRREGPRGAMSTNVTQLSPEALLEDYKIRHPEKADTATLEGTREHIAKHCSAVHAEGFFASKIILVEGDAEVCALPIYARALDYDLDYHGVSVVPGNGKTSLPTLLRLYNEFRIPVFVVFDGDKGKTDAHPETNRELLQLASATPEDSPDTCVAKRHAVFEADFETTMRAEVPDYDDLAEQADRELNLDPDRAKGVRAKYIAGKLVQRGEAQKDPSLHVPPSILQIVQRLRELEWERSVLQPAQPLTPNG
jgi:putative ATP-dependent endonuclease of OLD family